MPSKTGSRALSWLFQRRAAALWARRADRAATAELSLLRRHRADARVLRDALDRLIATAESRLAQPRVGSQGFTRPTGTDWSWRPKMWRGPFQALGLANIENQTAFGDEITLFHDSQAPELSLRQTRNLHEEDAAPYAVTLDVLHFEGSFLSLVLDLPPEACAGLAKHHILRVDIATKMERPLRIFARLNVKHGPNVEQLVRELPQDTAQGFVEFDLAYTKLNEKRVEKAWLDLIFDTPAMSSITLTDLTFTRFPRAEL